MFCHQFQPLCQQINQIKELVRTKLNTEHYLLQLRKVRDPEKKTQKIT